jgi:flagellar basal-body rod modification protein FlgD
MSEIDTKNPYSQLGINSTQSSSSTDANDELGQEDFLELMTAQLKFQDPLSPMENGEFLSQMAQFGTVSGINELNDAVSSISAAFQSNQALEASTMVGRSVLVEGSLMVLTPDETAYGAVELDQSANQVIVNISDASGQLVRRLDLGQQPAGLVEFEWNGVNEDGDPVSAGDYQISAEIHSGSEVSAGITLSRVNVESVTLGQAGQDFTLTVSGLGDISMSQIRKIM